MELCRGCTLKFREASTRPKAQPLSVRPYDSRVDQPDSWARVRSNLMAQLRAAKQAGSSDAIERLNVPQRHNVRWKRRHPTPGERAVTLIVTLATGESVSVPVTGDFTFLDVLRACGTESGVWMVELFGLCRLLEDGSEVWLLSLIHI